MDVNGREVNNSQVSVGMGSNMLPMDVSGLEPGLYVLRMTNGANSASIRFVKQ